EGGFLPPSHFPRCYVTDIFSEVFRQSAQGVLTPCTHSPLLCHISFQRGFMTVCGADVRAYKCLILAVISRSTSAVSWAGAWRLRSLRVTMPTRRRPSTTGRRRTCSRLKSAAAWSRLAVGGTVATRAVITRATEVSCK